MWCVLSRGGRSNTVRICSCFLPSTASGSGSDGSGSSGYGSGIHADCNGNGSGSSGSGSDGSGSGQEVMAGRKKEQILNKQVLLESKHDI